jgi:hypothetical protein
MNPEEERRKHQTLARKQTGINHEAPGLIYNLYRVNSIWSTVTKFAIDKLGIL